MRNRGRMKYEDWVELGAEGLRQSGPAPFTVDNLCARAGRTKGSFYHHFEGIQVFTMAVVRHWIEHETDIVARAALKDEAPLEKLRAMWRLTAATDHRLELGIRAMALTDGAIATLVADTDKRREAIMTGLLGAAYALDEERASNFARLFHALHLSAQMRAPEDIAGFSRGSVRTLVELLEREEKTRKPRART
ncbi:MAG: TetR/AcrR family transcriptional regulator [Sphingosinicella sp.]|nr:TetR/AcrR family transcriptional regulator [Sphingosinicella sp.]